MVSPFILSFSGNTELHVCTFFLNSGFLTGKCTQVVQFRTTYFTVTNNFNFFDTWSVDWEDTLNTYTVRDLRTV